MRTTEWVPTDGWNGRRWSLKHLGSTVGRIIKFECEDFWRAARVREIEDIGFTSIHEAAKHIEGAL